MGEFPLIGGRAVLDLCNTLDAEGDHLDAPAALARWIAAVGLAVPDLPPDEADLARVVRLRDGLRTAFVTRDAVRVAELTDEWLRDTRWHLSVDCSCQRVSFRPDTPDCNCALAPMLLDALDLARDDIARVRECASDRCTLIYLDVSRNHSRRWCSMERCGSRAKAHAYYERHRRRI